MPPFSQKDAEVLAEAIGLHEPARIRRLRIDLNRAAEEIVPAARWVGKGMPPGRAADSADRIRRAAEELVGLLEPVDAGPEEAQREPTVLPDLIFALAGHPAVEIPTQQQVQAARERLIALREELGNLARAAEAAADIRSSQVEPGRGGRRHSGNKGLQIVMPLLLTPSRERPASHPE